MSTVGIQWKPLNIITHRGSGTGTNGGGAGERGGGKGKGKEGRTFYTKAIRTWVIFIYCRRETTA